MSEQPTGTGALAKAFWTKVGRHDQPDDCWPWIACKDGGGYGRLGQDKAHRVSWLLNVGPIPEGRKVLHQCDRPACVNPAHLFIGTQLDNVRDMMVKGRAVRGDVSGTKNPQAKLTDAEVARMKAYRSDTRLPYHIIGDHFGVSTMTAFRAITGRAWRHVE